MLKDAIEHIDEIAARGLAFDAQQQLLDLADVGELQFTQRF